MLSDLPEIPKLNGKMLSDSPKMFIPSGKIFSFPKKSVKFSG